MKYYRVQLNGENFLVRLDSEITYLGFYTTRYVEAANVDEAELKGAALVRNDECLKSITLNKNDRTPSLYVDEVFQVDEQEMTNAEDGFGWYKMEE